VVYSTITFVYDFTRPTVVVSRPVSERYYGANPANPAEAAYYLDLMDGTSADLFDIARAEVQLYDVQSSSYWHTTGWTVNVSSWLYAGALSWSYAPPTLRDGYRYRLEARAFDIAGNMSNYATNYFYYDSSSPVAGITAPGLTGFYNNLPQLAGTAADPAGGGAYYSDAYKVEVAIQKYPLIGGQWWTGASFTSNDRVWLTDTTHPWPNWTLSGVSTPTWVTNTKYHIEARALDVARNTSTIVTQDFVYDTQVPDVLLTEPSGLLTHLGSLMYIQGTSADSNALGQIREAQIRVKNLEDSQYWRWAGSNYLESSESAAWFVVSATETIPFPYAKWFSTGTSPGGPAGVTLVSGKSYEINARALDKAGNYSSLFSTRTITYDIHMPTGAVTSFAASAPWLYQRQISPLSGSAFDAPSGGAAGLALLNAGGAQVRILEVETGLWWDNTGGSFNITDGNAAWTNCTGASSALWTYAHAALNGQLYTGRNYLAQFRGKDTSTPPNTGPSTDGLVASYTLAKDSVTFTADKLEPVSRVTFPKDDARLKVMNTITGTAIDALSGIAVMGQVGVSVQQVSPGTDWWNGVAGGGFAPGSEVFYPLTPARNGTYAGNDWSISAPGLQDGYRYRVRVQATDNAQPGGNTETDISSITFVYDITAPLAAITYPIGMPDLRANLKALPTVSGTAFESFGIKSASISVQEVGGPYYDPYAVPFATFSSLTQKWITATISGTGPNYAWSAAAPELTDHKSYDIQIIADDLAGNVLIPPTATTVRFDNTPPLSGAVTPANGTFLKELSAITGTALDPVPNESTVAGSQLKIQRSDGNYWNGSSWGAPEIWLGGVAGAAWTKNTQLPPSTNTSDTLQDGVLYTIQTRSYDIAANTQTVYLAGNSFRFDVSSPTAFIGLPLNGERKVSLPLVSGTASDAFNVNFPQIRIYNGQAKYWMEGTGSCGTTVLPDWVGTECPAHPNIWNVALGSSSAGGSFTWTYDSSSLSWPNRDNELRVDVKVTDRAGNYSTTSSTFSFDNVLPASRITYPPANGTFYSSMTVITGTSYDLTSAINDVRIRAPGPRTTSFRPLPILPTRCRTVSSIRYRPVPTTWPPIRRPSTWPAIPSGSTFPALPLSSGCR